jgi:hypothetical protein
VSKRISVLLIVLGLFALAAGVAVAWASADPGPSGERIIGGTGVGGVGGTVVEPVYDDMTGVIRYVSTPRGTPDPVKSNPVASAPFYLPVYPVGSSVPATFTLNCLDVPVENCPDHGAAVAGAAQAIMPSVYGGGVIGHDHLMAGPASHGDFNVAWVPTLVLFTTTAAANQHLVTEAQVEAAVDSGQAIEVALDGTHGTPNLTFLCAVVPAAVYARGTPWVLSP